MTLVRVQIQMIESKVQQTDYQTTCFLCDNGHEIAKHKFQNHQSSFLNPFHPQKYAPFSISFTTVL